ncbi:MAG: divalent-cation tolerance protein CutA [Chloroflexi bacterium]|nr:divalent-cation tolerance protein CutA [Chloroflexota bacterium]
MADASYAVVFITTSDSAEAEKIARALLEHKKAACVNIVPRVDSRYWWEGKIEISPECQLVVKTKAALLPDIVNLVKGLHSYAVPEVIALPVLGGNPDYLDWIDKSLA